MSLSGRVSPFNKRCERIIVPSARVAYQVSCHGRSKHWLDAVPLDYIRAIHDHSPLPEELKEKQLAECIESADRNQHGSARRGG